MIAEPLLEPADGDARRAALAACLEKIGTSPDAAGIFAFADVAGVERALGAAPAGPLGGVLLAVADTLLVRGMPCEASSRLLAGFAPSCDAAAVERLKAAGAIVAGKTRVPEFGIPDAGSPARDRGPDAVAAGMCRAAVGVDADGSFRSAAAGSGVAAFKPSYGLVSRHGVVSVAPSLETVSIAAGRVGDLAPPLCVIAGHDPRDVASRPEPPPDFVAGAGRGVGGMRVGVIREFGGAGVAEPLGALTGAGMTETGVDLPSFRLWNAVHSIVFHAEAGSQLGRYDGIRFGAHPQGAGDWESVYSGARAGFGPGAKRAVMLGAFALSREGIDAYHQQALRLRERIRRELAAAWERVDVLLVPAPAGPRGLAARRGANLSGCAALAPAGKEYEIWAAPFRDHVALAAGFLAPASVHGSQARC